MGIQEAFYKAIIKTLGDQSTGIRLCQTHGMNSAEVMDYIYRPRLEPTGTSFLGKWADSLFLNYPTWKSIRERKKNLEDMLYKIIFNRLKNAGYEEIRILDLASGYGQYLFEVMKRLGPLSEKVTIEMHDKNPDCEYHINKLNKNNGYRISFVCSDIGTEETYNFGTHYDIIICAGFYDSLDMYDSKKLEETFHLITRIMQDDTLFVLTYQSSHVNTQLVNDVFTDTDGNKLNMGERQIADMKYYIHGAGLESVGALQDAQKRYTVNVTTKNNVIVEHNLLGN